MTDENRIFRQTALGRLRSALLAVCALFVLAAAPTPVVAQDGDPVTVFSPDDQKMNAAIDAARSNFGAFIDLMGKHPQGQFLLKVAIRHANGQEHIWMALVDFQDGQFVGQVVNQGVEIPYGPGDRYSAKMEEISDWAVYAPPYESGPIYGAYTLRVIEETHPGTLGPDFMARLQPLQ